MSLTSLIQKNRRFRTAVRTHTQRPTFPRDASILSEPRSKRYGVVGTAFDYLVSYTLIHLGEDKAQRPEVMVFDRALEILKAHTPSVVSKEHLMQARRAVAHCKNQAVSYVEKGELTSEFVSSLLQVAQLDQIYRGGLMPRLPLPKASKANVEDLLEMHRHMPTVQMTARDRVDVSPDFGMASQLVGGADADFIIDGRLIDTKTTQAPSITLEMWCQVVGYYLLNRLEGGSSGRCIPVDKLGFYFARYGIFCEIDVEDAITDPDHLTSVLLSP